LNTHPAELNEPGLIESIREVREASPTQAITLEIHERAVTSPAAMRELQAHLRELDVKLAYDDFGAGQARLVELVEVRPDFLKFDINLIKDVHLASSERQQLLKNLVRMVNDLGVISLAEGVESRGESEFCRDAGFQLGQGYYYGRPAPVQSKRKQSSRPSDKPGT
jgi:EAL domain-containing protein (putative c-di-GMP-specific phosphodiesterase class I)